MNFQFGAVRRTDLVLYLTMQVFMCKFHPVLRCLSEENAARFSPQLTQALLTQALLTQALLTQALLK